MDNNSYIAEWKKTYIGLTILFNIIFLVFKSMTLGWFTMIFILFLPAFLTLYNFASITTALIKNKTIKDHIRFWCLNFSLLLFGLTFVDTADIGPASKIINFLPSIILWIISYFSFVLCIVLSIKSIIIYKKRKKITQ